MNFVLLYFMIFNIVKIPEKKKKVLSFQMAEHQSRLHSYEGSGSPLNSRTSTPTKVQHSGAAVERYDSFLIPSNLGSEVAQ